MILYDTKYRYIFLSVKHMYIETKIMNQPKPYFKSND